VFEALLYGSPEDSRYHLSRAEKVGEVGRGKQGEVLKG